MSEKLKSVTEIAELYNVTTVTVYNWIADGLPFEVERTGGRRTRKVIRQKDVDAFLDASR